MNTKPTDNPYLKHAIMPYQPNGHCAIKAESQTIAKKEEMKRHERLQSEVERIYQEYTQIAKTSHQNIASQLYQKYQETYDEYIKAYNEFARQYTQEQQQKHIHQEIKKESIKSEYKQQSDDNEEDQDYDLKTIPKKRVKTETESDMIPTTTISTISEAIHCNNDISDQQDDDD